MMHLTKNKKLTLALALVGLIIVNNTVLGSESNIAAKTLTDGIVSGSTAEKSSQAIVATIPAEKNTTTGSGKPQANRMIPAGHFTSTMTCSS